MASSGTRALNGLMASDATVPAVATRVVVVVTGVSFRLARVGTLTIARPIATPPREQADERRGSAGRPRSMVALLSQVSVSGRPRKTSEPAGPPLLDEGIGDTFVSVAPADGGSHGHAGVVKIGMGEPTHWRAGLRIATIDAR